MLKSRFVRTFLALSLVVLLMGSFLVPVFARTLSQPHRILWN